MSRRVYADFDAELLLRLANRSDITSAQRGFFLRDGYLDICNRFKHVQLQAKSDAENLPIGQDNFTPAVTDMWYPAGLRNVTNGYILRQESWWRVERAQTKPTSQPYTFYWYNFNLVFESFADTAKVMKLWYKKRPADWTTGSPAIDEIFDPLIIMAAAKAGFETVRELDEAVKEEGAIMRAGQEKHLPLEDVKLYDYRQGFRVRFK